MYECPHLATHQTSPAGSRRGARGWLRQLARGLLLLMLVTLSCAAGAEDSWEYAPYEIEVWLDAQPSPILNAALQRQLLDELQVQAPVHAGATWRLTAGVVPAALRGSLRAALDEVSVEQVTACVPAGPWPDKLMLLGVEEQHGRIRLACRELDSRTRTLGPAVRRESPQLVRLARDAADLIAETFSPLVRIEATRGKRATVRVRAGGLMVDPSGVSAVGAGDVLRPVLRRNDRRGEPRPGGIQVLDWTYLLARERQEHLLECDVYSAMRNPLGGRSSPSLERFALKVRPRASSTLLRLVTRDTPGSEPLAGYTIFARPPVAEAAGSGTTSVRLGVTDWRGLLRIERAESPLRILYVKNGRQLLARLPLVPGAEDIQTIALPSDDTRLEAEAFVRGIENRVMDLVARREILAARIRARIRDGKLAEARQYLEELKTLPTKDDFEALLVSHRQSGALAADERQLQRIDQMLNGARILLARHLNPQLVVLLEREVDAAAAGGPVAPAAQPPPPPAEAPAGPATPATS